MSEFRRARGSLLRAGADRSVLEGGIARLSKLEARKTAEIEQLALQHSAIGRVQLQISEAVSEGARLGAKHRADLERLISEHAAGFRDEVLAEENPEQLKLKAERLAEWWNDEALQVELRQWAKKAAEELNAWRKRSFEAIERRLKSAEFQAAFSDYAEEAPGSPDVKEGTRGFSEVFDKVGRATGATTRDIVYNIGKAFRFKFKPWGAVKLAKALGKAGSVMVVVGVALDIADLFLAERRNTKREEARQKIAAFLIKSVPRVVETVAQGSEEEPGVLRPLEGVFQILREFEAEQSEERERLAAQIADARERLSVYSALRTEACALLGEPWS